jgi:hypothetical protein
MLKLLAQAAATAQIGGVKQPNDRHYPVSTLRAIGPKDDLEALLAVQMVGTHKLRHGISPQGFECGVPTRN